MHSQELEDLTLFLIRDTAEADMWLDRWAVSYPTVRVAEINRHDSLSQWQQQLHPIWQTIRSETVVIVAHGAGVSGCLAWLYQTDIHTQKRIRHMLLVAPLQTALPDDPNHTLQRIRCHCPTALVIGKDDPHCPAEWAQQQANLWHAKLLVSPHTGHLNQALSGWQWGMKLLQEMLLS